MRTLLLALTFSAATLSAQNDAWHPLGKWAGSGSRETETFPTTQREWRIRWTASRSGSASELNAIVRRDDGRLVTIITTGKDEGGGESYVRSPPGKHHIAVNSFNVKWTLLAEEQR